MGQLKERHTESDGFNSLRLEWTSKTHESNQASDKREGYRLIFDLPARMEVANDPKSYQKENYQGLGKEFLNSQKQSNAERGGSSIDLSGPEKQVLKRNPLNGFLCSVVSSVNRKGE
ncbi:hypothetical protein ACV07N_10275 [Roseivirga echinicomitans]